MHFDRLRRELQSQHDRLQTSNKTRTRGQKRLGEKEKGIHTLRPTPTSLPNKKPTPHRPRIDLPRLLIHQRLLRLHYSPGLALVINPQHLGPNLKFPPVGGNGEGFEELDFTLAVDDTFGVEFGDTGDGFAARAGVEVDYFAVGVFKREDDRIRWKDGKVGVEFLGWILDFCWWIGVLVGSSGRYIRT
jgi:hypothetical protein